MKKETKNCANASNHYEKKKKKKMNFSSKRDEIGCLEYFPIFFVQSHPLKFTHAQDSGKNREVKNNQFTFFLHFNKLYVL